ncbi:hypothetical protein M8494_19015 [Serratia ureilytica]
MLDEVIVEGISTMEINDRAEAFIVEELVAPGQQGGSMISLMCSTPQSTTWCATGAVGQQNPAFGMIVNVDITLENGGYADSAKCTASAR